MASARLVGAVRQFSTSAVRAKLVTPPLQVFGIEGRYATALYSAASKEKKLDVVEKELNSLQAAVKTDAKFIEFIGNPTIKKTAKRDVMVSILEQRKCSPVTVNFFAALAENGRLSRMNGVLKTFGRLMGAHRGEVDCSVTTSKALDAAQLKELKSVLGGFMEKGQTLQLETKVDPNIVGGMIVYIGDRYADMSTVSKIKTYTNLISEAI